MSSPRLAVLISGRGRNLQALIQAQRDGRIPADFAVVISNKADAEGLAHARAAGIAVEVIPHAQYSGRAAFDAALAEALRRHGADLVALARAMLYDPRWPWHAAARLGAQVQAPKQYWRSQPRALKNLFGDTPMGQR